MTDRDDTFTRQASRGVGVIVLLSLAVALGGWLMAVVVSWIF